MEITTSNHAVPDYNTFLIARHKDWFLENINPDLVIMYIGVNDILSKGIHRRLRIECKSLQLPLSKKVSFKIETFDGTVTASTTLQQHTAKQKSRIRSAY